MTLALRANRKSSVRPPDWYRQTRFSVPYFWIVGKPEAIAPAFSLCTRRPGEFEDCPKGCSSQGSGDSDNLSDNLCILMVSQPLRSLVAR